MFRIFITSFSLWRVLCYSHEQICIVALNPDVRQNPPHLEVCSTLIPFLPFIILISEINCPLNFQKITFWIILKGVILLTARIILGFPELERFLKIRKFKMMCQNTFSSKYEPFCGKKRVFNFPSTCEYPFPRNHQVAFCENFTTKSFILQES